ncbi:putative glycosyltransferase [Gordonia aichiensis NBRC 108223]|uniref:Putative glycosyltransferase n=2 Tax=Gordonia aichiensis TaxID=36820 RepID=L7KEG0_9ACTN|nr:putative glycosyltransferase [Gordonia aichiensis NBRC 108223]
MCLDHLLEQTQPIGEIIVVNNASTDRTADVVSEYIAEYGDRVRLINEPTKGVVAARRCGFDAASSDIIAKTDADTLVSSTWAESIVRFFDSERGRDHAAVTGPVIMWDGPSYELQRKVSAAGMGKLAEGGDIEGIHGPNYALRAAAWLQVRDDLTDRADIWEDLDLALALRDRGLRRYFDPAVAVAASCRQLRHSPWANRSYILGGIRTARARGDRRVELMMTAELPFRIATFTAMWLVFRPWDDVQENWRPQRLFRTLERRRPLVTAER